MFYREKAYTRINWKNRPNLSTPLGAKNLNKMDATINELDDRIIEVSSEVEMDSLTIGFISDKVNALEEDVADNSLQIRVTTAHVDSLLEDIQGVAEDVDGLKIVNTASGTTAYMDDASNMGLEDIDFYGESKQMQTTGKNLLQNTATTKNTGGVTFTINSDGSVKANGTATALVILTLNSFTNTDKDLILSGCPSGGSNSTYKLSYYNETTQVNDLGSGVTLPKNNLTYEVRIVIYSGTSVNNLTFYPMIRLATVTDATYEPFTNGVASPSPDYPQPIESKIVKRVDVLRKNWLKFSQGSTTNNGITFTVNADKSVTVNGTATADAVLLLTTSTRGDIDLKRLTGKNIILSGCPKGGSSSSYRFQFWSDSKMAVDTGNGATLDLSTVPDTWNFAISIIGGTTVNNLTFKPMIRLASITDATYEPYQSQTVNLSAPIELNGIGGVRDTDKVKKFGVVVFDGSDDEGWATMDTQTAGVKRLYTRAIPVKPVADNNSKPNMLCSHYKITTTGNVWGKTVGITASPKATDGLNTLVYLYDENFNTADVSLWKAHLQANPMTVVYELAEPIETTLPIVDQTAIKNLHTYKPNTVVMNDADAEMDVKYVSDVKIYIDRKFEALASAIVNQ